MSDDERREIAERTSNRSKGEKNPMFGHRGGHKLSAEQLQEIHVLFQTTTFSNEKIAKQYGVSKQTIMYRRREFHWSVIQSARISGSDPDNGGSSPS